MRKIWTYVAGTAVLAVLAGGAVGQSTSFVPQAMAMTPPASARQTSATAASVEMAAASEPAAPPMETAEPPQPTGHAKNLDVTPDDYSLGPKDAKVTIVEYASLTCPHCAHFNTEILPGLLKEYVDTGKVQYVYRDFPLDRLALAAGMIARCAGRSEYFGFVDTFFSTQIEWATANKPLDALSNLARLGGMSKAKFDACLKDTKIQNAILKERLKAVNDYKVNATPTIFVNGDEYPGGMTLPQFRTLLNRLLAKS